MRFIISKYNSIPKEAKASFWYTICSVLQKCISFLTIPIFTRILTTAEYGQMSIYITWTAIIMIFTTLNLQYGSFNTAMMKFENHQDNYIASIQGISLFLTFITLVFFIIFPNFFVTLLDLPLYLLIIMLFEIIFTTSINLWSGKKRFDNKYIILIVVTLLLSLCSPLLSLFLIYQNNYSNSLMKILGNALTYFVFGGVIFFINLKRGKSLFNKEYWLYAFKFNIPLLPYYLSQIIFNQSDRIMIQKMIGFEEAGIYSLAYSISLTLSFVINAINNSYIPWLYKSIKTKKFMEIRQTTTKLIYLILILLSMFILFAPEIISFFSSNEYKDAVYIMPPVVMSQLFLFLSQICINILFFYEDKYSLVSGSILSAIINIVLNYLLIPSFGYIMAGYTTLFSYIIFYFMNLKNMYYKWNKFNNGCSLPFNFKTLNCVCFIFVFFTTGFVFLFKFLFLRIFIFFIMLVFSIIMFYKYFKCKEVLK